MHAVEKRRQVFTARVGSIHLRTGWSAERQASRQHGAKQYGGRNSASLEHSRTPLRSHAWTELSAAVNCWIQYIVHSLTESSLPGACTLKSSPISFPL
jgi:hypothetical protein